MIRLMTQKDISAAIDLYANHMFDSFFNDLGQGFLRVIFESALASKYARCYVWEEGSFMPGFIISATDSRALFREIFWKKAFLLLIQAALFVIKKPSLCLKILESFFYFRRTKLEDVKAEFLFISIDPAYRNRGISKELIAKTLAEFSERGISRTKVTSKKDNHIVNNLLRSLGFNLIDSFEFHGKENLLYEVRVSHAKE